jgi:hypothetical protein
MTTLEIFCRQIRARSSDHRQAMYLLHERRILSQVVAILRQELDSMVRVIYLLSVADKSYRQQLIDASVNGDRWTAKGKRTLITDHEMVELAQSLHGWTKSIYEFGCKLIHLSSFHDYENRDPLISLPIGEKTVILQYVQDHYGCPEVADPTVEDILPYLPQVFQKVADNLEYYVKQLEAQETPAKDTI